MNINKENINTVQYWDQRFQTGSWTTKNGIEQTVYWGNLILENLPNNIWDDIDSAQFIIDMGCALGQFTNILQNTFENAIVYGIDNSSVAIEIAQKIYPNINFNTTFSPFNADVIFASNILEHIPNYLEFIKNGLEFTNQYYVILSPWAENIDTLVDEHVVIFNDIEQDFPKILNNFERCFYKIIPTNPEFWEDEGGSVLVIYKKIC